MAAKEKKYREKWGYEGAMVWQVTRKMFYEVILQNAEVKELIESYKKNPLAYIATTTTAPTTRELFLAAFRDYREFPRLRLWKNVNVTLPILVILIVQGWDVRLPFASAGYACESNTPTTSTNRCLISTVRA